VLLGLLMLPFAAVPLSGRKDSKPWMRFWLTLSALFAATVSGAGLPVWVPLTKTMVQLAAPCVPRALVIV
jgi:hypothetical protein